VAVEGDGIAGLDVQRRQPQHVAELGAVLEACGLEDGVCHKRVTT
jgi:hypothetical protein